MTTARTAYREADVRSASPVRLVVLLCDQMIEDLRQAAQALEQNDIERRTNRINHAILVIGHLQSALDFANGGKVAQDLDNFYNVLRQNLMQAQFFPSEAGLSQLIVDVLAVREAWIEVDRAEQPLATSAAATVPSSAGGSESEAVRVDWKG
jgi:flagellar secretion chaperone FliS